ncbi:hypothetical protein GQ600_18985 [Phytophthora cactorum]|nr:hypothetical protein GQ600_18985 [Phytophthora cactorum]
MFLELSFASTDGGKGATASNASRSWRYDHEEKEEMSLDELISDFQQSASSRRSRLNQSKPSSNASSLLIASPPKYSKVKANAGRPRTVKPQSVKRKPTRSTANSAQLEDSSDDEAAVSPMPRIEHVLRNKPSLVGKRCSACSPVSTRSKPATSTQRRKPEVKSPVLPSPPLTPPSLSPVTSSSVTSSPLSVSEDIYSSEILDEDSIDALIGKEIRDLNELISTGSRVKANSSARSPTTAEVWSTHFGKTSSKDHRSSLRLGVPKEKSRPSAPESPPPPPPPEDSEDDEEDSFAEEIRKLRESHRVPTKAPEKDPLKEENKSESSEVCAVAALNVRNASNAINELLLEALKPFEDREKEEERDKTLEEEKTEGDAAIRNAAHAELQSATRTIVSQLDLTLADMTERRKVDLKAEEDAAAAMKEAEKKEKEAAAEKKKTEEKETKEREMEILRLIPMQGKLLTCSADIDSVLEQLEGAAISTQGGNESTVNAEIRALRSQTQRKIQEIEARMSAAPSKKEEGGPNVGISWRNVDWAQDNIKTDLITSTGQDGDEEPEDAVIDVEPAEREAPFEEVLQRQVLEKLDLTMLKLRHVLSISTKEAAEEMKTQQREQEKQERKHEQQQVEDERKQRELDDAETARRRVMGLTSIEDVEGWIDEGQSLQDRLWLNQSLNRLMASMEHRMGAENSGNPYFNSVPQNQNEDQFDRLASSMKTGEPRGDLFRTQNKNYGKRSGRRQMETKRVQEVNNPRWIEIASCSSDSEVEADSTYTSGGSEFGERLPSV